MACAPGLKTATFVVTESPRGLKRRSLTHTSCLSDQSIQGEWEAQSTVAETAALNLPEGQLPETPRRGEQAATCQVCSCSQHHFVTFEIEVVYARALVCTAWSRPASQRHQTEPCEINTRPAATCAVTLANDPYLCCIFTTTGVVLTYDHSARARPCDLQSVAAR